MSSWHNSLERSSDPCPSVVHLLLFPPLVYATSLWLSHTVADSFEACAPGGPSALSSGWHPLVQATAVQMANFLSGVLITTWVLAWLISLLIFTVALPGEKFAVAVGGFARTSTLIYSVLALIPLLAGGVACIV